MGGWHREISPAEIVENRDWMRQRDRNFLQFGYDSAATVEFVLQQALPLDEPVLEVATGKGRFLTRLASEVPRVTTVELDAAEQEIARLNAADAGVLARIDFVVADATRLPWPDNYFGSVVSMNTLHHVEEVAAVLAEFVRVVRTDGKIVISDFDEAGFAVMDRIHAAEGNAHPRSSYTSGDVVAFIESQGWKCRTENGAMQNVIIAVGPGRRE